MTEEYFGNNQRIRRYIGSALAATLISASVGCFHPGYVASNEFSTDSVTVDTATTRVVVGSERRDCLIKYFFNHNQNGQQKITPDTVKVNGLEDCKEIKQPKQFF